MKSNNGVRMGGISMIAVAIAACNADGGWEGEATVEVAELRPGGTSPTAIGSEVGVAQHMADGDEFRVTMPRLLRHGRTLFEVSYSDTWYRDAKKKDGG